ncbi:MAG: hypothetical protein K0R14_432 [Burkholderiales bacterium]|jgi:hypothetical protein|nr:hypothetical protein [Burkholderiales bacterium]
MNKMFLHSIRLLLISLAFINFANAIIPASVDRSTPGLGQSFTLTIDASKANSDPDLSPLNTNFEILGTSTSSQTSIVNGNVSSQKSFIISLSPKNPGKQTIPSITVGNDKTAPIAIEVTKPNAREQAIQKSQIFVDTKILGKPSYIGIPFVYTMKLYFAVNISNVNMADINITGATIKPLEKSTQYSENIQGINYRVLEQKFQITPNQSGNITIPPIKISGSTMTDDIGNDFFAIPRPRPFSVSSKAVAVAIKPLPSGVTQDEWFPAKQVMVSENQPNTSNTIKLGQPITRTVTVSAVGVPDTSIPNLNLVTPPNVNAYPDKTVANTSTSGNDLLATKVFKVAYIPTQAGTITFPETIVKWWDMNTGMQKTAALPAKTYTVLNENGKAQDTTVAQANTNNTNAPASSITNQVTQQPQALSNQKNIWFYIAIIIALVWVITILICIILFRKKPVAIDNKAVETDKLNSEKKAKDMVLIACKDRNITALNTALIGWATLHFGKKIYTILDIKDISGNIALKKLIEEFNQTLYKGSSFDKFDALAHEIDMLAINKAATGSEGLKELYPK